MKRFDIRVQRDSFRVKVAAVAWITTILALLVAFSMVVIQQWDSQKARLVRERGALAQVLAENLSASVVFADAPAAKATLGAAGLVKGVRGATVFDKQGRVFTQASFDGAPAPGRAHGAAALAFRYSRQTLDLRVPIKVEHEQVGELALVSGLDELWLWLRGYLMVVTCAFCAATAVAVIVGLWLARIIIRPVSRLARAMDRVRASGDLDVAVRAESEDEVGVLTLAFNALLDELRRNDQSLRAALADLTTARDEAHQANLHKSQFLAHMSHEIRTPLNGVLGMVQAMRLHSLSADQAERLQIVQSSGEILLSILNNILDVSKIEAGKLELETTPFDPIQVVEAVRAIFAPNAAAKGLSLAVEVAPEARGLWLGDPVRVQQIVSNLVSNALKFTAEGSVGVAITADRDHLSIAVTDTGMGLDADQQGRLFESFSQAEVSTTRRFGGTGLGLSICRRLAQLMHGEVTVRSAPDQGACFTARLRLDRAPFQVPDGAARAPNAWPQAQASRRLRILGVDDNATNRRVLEALLAPLQPHLVLVSDGAEAVERWRTEPFDVVLMDVQMPVMDGLEATRRIRAIEQAEHRPATPILALSANAMAQQVSEYLAVGMDGHVAKPIDIAALYGALERAV